NDSPGGLVVDTPAGLQYTATQYDALGRVLRTELVGSGIPATTTSYGTASYTVLDGGATTGFLTTVTDPNGPSSRTIVYVLGHLVETRRQWSGCPGGFCSTRTKPDARGRVGKIQDANGNVTTIVYDGLGRKTQMTDPDMGTWSYGYDPNGNL